MLLDDVSRCLSDVCEARFTCARQQPARRDDAYLSYAVFEEHKGFLCSSYIPHEEVV